MTIFGIGLASTASGEFPVYVPESPTVAPVEDAVVDWNSIAPELPVDVRSFAQEFVALCERLGALHCGSGCAVDNMGDDGVLFDWNDGRLPVLSVLITPGLRVVYVGKFKDGGQVSGDDPSLSFVDRLLVRMMEECGHPIQSIDHSLVLSMRAIDEVAGGRTKLFFPPHGVDGLSVFSANGASDADLKRAGIHVARERGRPRLYGWCLTEEPAFRTHDLRVEPSLDKLSFGACRHMDVRGWPNEVGLRLKIAQALGEASRYKPLNRPIAIA